MTTTPAARPADAHFSSGPCAKRPGWSPEALKDAALGRSHRAKVGKAKLKLAIDLTREVLQVPADYRIGIVPASDTGAVEMALWSLLGARAGRRARLGELRRGLGHRRRQAAQAQGRAHAQGGLRRAARSRRRSISTTTSSSPGTARPRACACPNGDWIAADRKGLTICDATSAAFAQTLDWPKLDVVTFSWQKALGGEAAHGMLILSPRAVERLETYTPAWPLPKIFRMTKGGKLIEGIFEGETINTPSMLCVEDYLDALQLGEERSAGSTALIARADANAKVLADWVGEDAWVDFLAKDPAIALQHQRLPQGRRSGDRRRCRPRRRRPSPRSSRRCWRRRSVAYDIGAYRDAPPGLRIWCGATVETADVEALTAWLDWAFAEAKAELAKAA